MQVIIIIITHSLLMKIEKKNQAKQFLSLNRKKERRKIYEVLFEG